MPAALLTMILPALVPVFTDMFRGLIGRFTGGAGARPQNVAEAIQLMAAETERLRAIAELDKPATDISRWVADLRASFRYVAAGLIILSVPALVFARGAGMEIADWVIETQLQLAGSVFAFLFGDRMYMHMRKDGK